MKDFQLNVSHTQKKYKKIKLENSKWPCDRDKAIALHFNVIVLQLHSLVVLNKIYVILSSNLQHIIFDR